RRGENIKKPLQVYALLELAISLLGGGLVLLLPHLTKILLPLLQQFSGHPMVMNALRILTALILLLIPSTAMGATLPILTKALNQKLNNFGNVLGVLYGSNTLGAVLGVTLSDIFLVKYLG